MNKAFIREFNLLVKQIKIEYINAKMENNPVDVKTHEYRLKNIKKVLGIISNLDFEIKSVDDVKGIAGIGPGTLKRIKEILDMGKLSEIDDKYSDEKNKRIRDIQELSKVIGIGDKIAHKLVMKNGITSVAELKNAYREGRIKLSDQILMGLKYYGVVEENIPRKEIMHIEKYLEKVVDDISSELKIMICGSYRRGKTTSGDIDVLLFSPKIKTKEKLKESSFLEIFVDRLTVNKFILDHITNQNYKTKYMGFCKWKTNPVRRIDIRYIPYESVHSAMLYFTGPYELNTDMRRRAIKRDMILNEYGLYSDGELIPIKSEKDIFKKLGMKYLTPEERENYST